MTVRPQWGAEIIRILADTLRRYHHPHGLKNARRLTPNDTRDHERPAFMRRGKYWEGMKPLFSMAAEAGADLLAIESTGGKEVSDAAPMAVRLPRRVAWNDGLKMGFTLHIKHESRVRSWIGLARIQRAHCRQQRRCGATHRVDCGLYHRL